MPALRRAFRAGLRGEGEIFALTHLGSDAEVAMLLPLLKETDNRRGYVIHLSSTAGLAIARQWGKVDLMRAAVAGWVSAANLKDSRPACEALIEVIEDPCPDVRRAAVGSLGKFRDHRALPAMIETLRDSPDDVRRTAVRALGSFGDPAALPGIRELVTNPPVAIRSDDRGIYVDAVKNIGGPDAIALLNDMLTLGFQRHFGLEQALALFGSPSSARAAWAAYLEDPVRANAGSHVPVIGYREAFDVLIPCADRELLRTIRERARTTQDVDERQALQRLIESIEARLSD